MTTRSITLRTMLLLGAMLPAGAALAQDTPPATTAAAPDDAGIGDIVVTARKREENLQNVPLVITAFSGAKLEEKNVQSLRDLAALTPGLVISDIGAEAQSSPVIRGMSQTNYLRNGENNVSTFLDGVYIYNLNAINVSVLDLERVEVVKGPVSALYGRNSFAGAINYITRKPSLSDFGGRLEGELGTRGKVRLLAAASAPLVEGKLGLRISGVYDDYDGSYRDQVNRKRLGGFRKRGGQLTLLAKPTETLEIAATVYYGKDALGQPPGSYLTNNCAVSANVARKYCGRIPDGEDGRPPEQVTATAVDFAGNDREVWHGNLHVNLDVGGFTLESITGTNKNDTRYFTEFNARRDGLIYTTTAGTPFQTNAFFGRETNTRDFSQELRLASDASKPFRFQVGGFYYHLKLDTSVLVAVDTTRLPAGINLAGPASAFASRTGLPNRGRGIGKTDQYSAFATADYDVSDQFTASLEVRYTHEKKFFNQLSNATGAPAVDGDGRTAKFNYADARGTLNYKVTPDILLYASAAHGTKAGGFNDSATVPQDFTFEQETNWTYEAGAKTELLDRRLILNAAVYYIDWKNPQLQRPSSDPTNPAVQIGNVGRITGKGFDLESQFRAAPFLDLRAAVNYADTKFAKGSFDITSGNDCANIPSCASTRLITVNGLRATNLKGLLLPRQSRWNLTAGIDLHADLGDGGWGWFAGADYNHLSKQYFENSNFAYWGTRNTLSARVGVRSDRLRVTGQVSNLLNDSTPVNAGSNLRLTDFVFETLPILPEKRTFSVTAALSF